MGYLKEYIDEICKKCVADRMGNVLNPKCRKRFLISFRIMAGATIEDLPRFCYEQVLNNLKRYLAKKTTLYTPIDVYIYLNDFFDIFFPDISHGIIKKIKAKKYKEILSIINKSKLPAVHSKMRGQKPGLLKNILKKDKIIKEGSFIFDYNEDYFVIWHNNNLFIADFNKNIAICNVHNKNIGDLSIIDMILPLYAEGKEFKINLIRDKNLEPKIKIVIQAEKLIKIDDELRNQRFEEITEKISPKFPRVIFNFTDKADLEIIVEVNKECSYNDINFLFNQVSQLSEAEYLNLLEEESEG